MRNKIYSLPSGGDSVFNYGTFPFKKMCNWNRRICKELSALVILHFSVMFCYQITAICFSCIQQYFLNTSSVFIITYFGTSAPSTHKPSFAFLTKCCRWNVCGVQWLADPCGGVDLRPPVCRVCEFESRLGHGCLFLVSVVLWGRGLCFGLLTRPEESYRLWCVQWLWLWSPVRKGHDPESGRSDTGEKIVNIASSAFLSTFYFILVFSYYISF
jgi:hypothetical protein